jgi:hypothetical protein
VTRTNVLLTLAVVLGAQGVTWLILTLAGRGSMALGLMIATTCALLLTPGVGAPPTWRRWTN